MANDRKRKVRVKNLHKNILITVLAGTIVFFTVCIIIFVNRSPMTKYTELTVNGQTFNVEIADTPTKQQLGLMFRKELPDRTGMLFIFTRPDIQYFWMRNTYVPLDIIFIDEQKRIINISTMPPLTDDNCKSDRPAKYVLELEAGSARKYNLQPGQTVAFCLTP